MVLVLAAVSVRADDLHLDVMQDKLLGGEFYPNNSNSSWYIKFSAKVEGEDSVSACEIWTRKEGYLVEVTALKSPYKYTIEVTHIRARVIRAAKTTAKVLKLSQLLPATADDIAEALWNMAESLGNKTADMGKSQVRFAVMYHSIILRAALRIMNGAKQTKDICQVSPDYEYAESSSLFICTQDLHDLKNLLVLHEHQERGIMKRCSHDGLAQCIHYVSSRVCSFVSKKIKRRGIWKWVLKRACKKILREILVPCDETTGSGLADSKPLNSSTSC